MSVQETVADQLLVETVDRLLTDVCTPEEVEHAEASGWSQAVWSACADAGFPWVGIAESAGGSGGTLYDVAAILRAVGAHAAPVPIAETAMIGGWWLAEHGLSLPEGPVTVVDDPRAVQVRNGRVLLDGAVAWARHVDRIVAAVPLDGGSRLVSIPRQAVTITPGANMAGEARDHVEADLVLADLESAPLDVSADRMVERGVLSRVIMAAGALTRMAQMTVDYTHERRQFGKPVATFQAVQQHLVTVAQSAARAEMAAAVAVRALDRGSMGIEIAAARVVVDDAITIGTRAAHQAHGAMGVTREYPLHQLTRRLWAWRHEYGTTTQWRRRLGEQAAATGADDLFDLISR